QKARPYVDRGGDAGARNRSDHGDLYRRQRGAASPASVSELGSASVDRAAIQDGACGRGRAEVHLLARAESVIRIDGRLLEFRRGWRKLIGRKRAGIRARLASLRRFLSRVGRLSRAWPRVLG